MQDHVVPAGLVAVSVIPKAEPAFEVKKYWDIYECSYFMNRY